jgi:hypothetical protein
LPPLDERRALFADQLLQRSILGHDASREGFKLGPA